MRLSPTAVMFALSCAVFMTGAARAATVTIDGAPVTGAIVQAGHIMVPFRVPMEQIGAVVVWSETDKTGVASSNGQELIRTAIGSTTAFIGGYPKELTVAPVLVEPQHLEFVPVEVLPEISNAQLQLAADGSSATITGFDLAGVNAAGAGAASIDPQGKVLFVWVWLLPISALLCGFAYVYANGQVNASWAAAQARRARRP